MGLFQRLRDSGKKAGKVATQEVTNSALRTSPLYSNYENMFAQVRPLVDEMKAVRPYGIGRNGARLPITRTPELNVLDYPNEQMGWEDFIDTAFGTWLTESELNIHVWMDEKKNVFGYSILPVGSRISRGDGTSTFTVYSNGKSEVLADDEVMTLRYSRSPRSIDHGVAPASSVYVWAQIDDLTAQYERAYFENGAVPATITFIRSTTRTDYEKKRAALENGLKGAENKNKTIYVWRQTLDDESSRDEIEVKTIQGNNSTLSLKELIDIIDNRLNKSIGVSNFILGDDSSAKYDNAELSDRQFTKRRVFPALLSFWSQFQHELDRILGGLGYAIDFKLEIPELTDRLKVKADIASVNANTLTNLINAGARPSSVVDALELPEKWKAVADGIYSRALLNVQTAASSSQVAGAERPETATNDQLPSKATNDDIEIYKPVFSADERDEEDIYNTLMDIAKRIAKDDPDIDEKLAEASEQIFNILDGQGTAGGVEATARMLQIVGDTAITESIKGLEIKSAADISTMFVKDMKDRTDLVVSNFAGDTKKLVSSILNNRGEMTAKQIADEVYKALPRSRAESIARNETHYAFNAGRYAEDDQIQQKYGIKIELIWSAHMDGTTCDVCRAMDGKVVNLGESFPDHAMLDDGTDAHFEHSEYNDSGRQPNAHPNCRCTFKERIVK